MDTLTFMQFNEEMGDITNIEHTLEEIEMICRSEECEILNDTWDHEMEGAEGSLQVCIDSDVESFVTMMETVGLWQQTEMEDYTIDGYIPIVLTSGSNAIFVLPEEMEVEIDGEEVTCTVIFIDSDVQSYNEGLQ